VRRGPGKQGTRRKPLWALLAALDRKAGFAALTKAVWKNAAKEDSVLLELIEDWHGQDKIDWISRREFDDLVTAAIGSPGIIVGRALRRHFSDALSPKYYAEMVRLAWLGLRPYLENPVFWARLPKGKPVRVLQRACVDGNLEAVLDEHFWMRHQSLPTRERGLAADLVEALSVTTGAFSLHSVNKERLPRIRVRCHVAVPFGSSDEDDRSTGKAADERTPRSDELRNAFNSPFWPHVLATTSVGQEGLDFHTWCSRIVHWDLCPSPLELEQREGRIQRFGGLAIRRHLRDLGDGALASIATADKLCSLWGVVESLANAKYRDDSGLSPWWVLKGAAVSRYVFNLKQSRDLEKFKLLKEQRLIYRWRSDSRTRKTSSSSWQREAPHSRRRCGLWRSISRPSPETSLQRAAKTHSHPMRLNKRPPAPRWRQTTPQAWPLKTAAIPQKRARGSFYFFAAVRPRHKPSFLVQQLSVSIGRLLLTES
jgi:hypothetical protein